MIGITHTTPVNIGGEVKQIDWNNFKFRCHYLKDLIGGYHKKQDKPPLTQNQFEEVKKLEAKDKLTDKQKEKLENYKIKVEEWARKQNTVELEPSTITVLNKIWAEEVLSIRDVLLSKAVKRGVKQEDESIDLVNSVFDSKLKKNTHRLENNYLSGEPDLVTEKSIIDIKTCESWHTFYYKSIQTATDDYFWQLWAYCQLSGKEQAFIAYTLPSYDDETIAYQQSKTMDVDEENQIYLNMNFDRIPKNKRIKIAKVDVSGVDSLKVEKYLDKCREYLESRTVAFNNFNPILEK